MTGDEINKMNSDDFAYKLLSELEKEDAILSCKEMDMIEKFWGENRRGRRSALIQLTKPFAWLSDTVKNDDECAEAVAEIYVCL